MQIHYFRWVRPNFGDDINSWLWHEVSPGLIDLNDKSVLIGIGTILDATITKRFMTAQRFSSMGSGVGYGELPDLTRSEWENVTVRGPLSAKALHLPDSAVGTDGAILLAALDRCRALPDSERHGVVFMPHHKAPDFRKWRAICERAGVEYLDPEWDSIALVARIRSARLVLADAMHAAIVADTMRVPWVALSSSEQTNTFKWTDWTRSMRVDFMPYLLPPVSRSARIDSRFLSWHSEQHWVSPEQARDDQLVAKAAAHRTPTSAVWRRRRMLRRLARLTSSAVERAQNLPGIPEEAAVAALTDLKQQNGMLSQDAWFHDRLGYMHDRLRQIESSKSS